MTWYQVVRWSWRGEGDDAEPENEVELTTRNPAEAVAHLAALDRDERQTREVVTFGVDPANEVAWAEYDGEPELDRSNADDWLERQHRAFSRT